MGAWSNLISSIRSKVAGWVPFGGTVMTPTDDDVFAIASIHQLKGASFGVPDLETLADIPYEILDLGQVVTVQEHLRPSGELFPRTKYALYKLPPEGVKVSEVLNYNISDYWGLDVVIADANDGEYEVQYAPNVNNNKPPFLPTQISKEAYNAGYASDEDYATGNPADIIWKSEFDKSIHFWIRQRINAQSDWGIPQSIGNQSYRAGQYIDVIFKWVPKGEPRPARPAQFTATGELNNNPEGWINDPGTDYDTRILTEDLYRSQVLKDPFHKIQGPWDIPILVSSDPLLVRYGNTPGNTDFLNDTFWRGYYTPGLDLYQATRTDSASTDWTVVKIDNESGEKQEYVFKALPIGSTTQEIIDSTPTFPRPIGHAAPNNCQDGPFAVGTTEMLMVYQALKNIDGSFKNSTGWSVGKRFDGLDTIQAIIKESPGNVFYNRREGGVIVSAVSQIDLTAKLFKGPVEMTTGINSYKWYRGATLITFDAVTRLATNLGVELNSYHKISADGKTLTLFPGAVDASQEYKVGINSVTRATDYEDTIQVRDATDDGNAYVADILPVQGSTFKNKSGEYQFNSQFIIGGIVDNTGVTFKWSIVDALGNPLTDGLKDSVGAVLGDTDVTAATVYVHGSSIDQYATLKLTATIGDITRTDSITLTDTSDAAALEVLYWGSGDANPGNPTDFSDRTITKAAVLALGIGYTEVADGAWYAIFRTEGQWGGEIQLRGETPRPNGGISLNIYKNVDYDVDGPPPAPGVPVSGSIIPSGWTSTPTEFTGTQDVTYTTTCLFLLRTDVDADPSSLTRDNYNPLGAYGTPVRITGFDGSTPPPVDDGENGWTPVLAVVADGERRVLKVVDYVDGTGTKPTANTSSSYVGSSGLTTIGAATDIRGPAGSSTNSRPEYYVSTGVRSDPAYASLTSTRTKIRELTITNNHTKSRRFYVQASLNVREDDNTEVVEGELTGPGSSFTILYDRALAHVDVGGIAQGTPIRLFGDVLIPAGGSETVVLRAFVRMGGNCYRNSGFIEAFGL